MNIESFQPEQPEHEEGTHSRLTSEAYLSLVARYNELSRAMLDTSTRVVHKVHASETHPISAREAHEHYMDEKYLPMEALYIEAREVHGQLIAEEDARLAEAQSLLAQGKETYWPDGTRPERKQAVGVVRNEVVAYGKGGVTHPITEGDLATAPMWDREYRLSPAVPSTYTSRYLTTRHKHAKDEYDDRLMMLEALSNRINDTSPTLDAYMNILQRALYGETPQKLDEDAQEKRKRQNAELGLMAEKMVKSFFTKLCINNASLGINLVPVPLQEDVEGQVDFVLHIENTEGEHKRGVKSDTHDAQNIAIQFTTARNDQVLEHKGVQLARQRKLDAVLGRKAYDARVLVTLPLKSMLRITEDWQKAGNRIPGGAERLCTPEEQEEIFRGVLQQLPEGLIDVDATWEQVRGA